MIEITIDDREVKKMLEGLSSKLKDIRPLMKEIAGLMHNAVEENFEQEGRPRWKPSKRALKESDRQDTGLQAIGYRLKAKVSTG
jgi:phage gpG-like protein